MRLSGLLRDKIASGKCSHLVVSKKDLATTEGFPLSVFESAGLSKSDLQRLEHYGLAKRGYTQNYFPIHLPPDRSSSPESATNPLPGSPLALPPASFPITPPSGSKQKTIHRYGKGHEVRWVLLAD